MLEINTIAPDFSLPDETEKTHTLADFSGSWLVLYFYPKDDTPGCTQEACTIADAYDEFEKLGVSVVGVSKDSPASHAAFKEKYKLPFTLLSDEATTVLAAYGALEAGEGKRVTYIITPDGKIAAVYEEVTPADHASQLLSDLQSLIS